MDAVYLSREVLDTIYVMSIPLILYLVLRTNRNSKRRLDLIVAELAETNRLLSELKEQQSET